MTLMKISLLLMQIRWQHTQQYISQRTLYSNDDMGWFIIERSIWTIDFQTGDIWHHWNAHHLRLRTSITITYIYRLTESFGKHRHTRTSVAHTPVIIIYNFMHINMKMVGFEFHVNRVHIGREPMWGTKSSELAISRPLTCTARITGHTRRHEHFQWVIILIV